MKGMDLLDAMEHLEDQYIEEARRFPGRTPGVLKWLSIAACVLCCVLVGGIAVYRFSPPETGALAETQEEQTLLYSTVCDLSMQVPTALADQIVVDESIWFDGNDYDICNEMAFYFRDTSQDAGGFLWGIYAFPLYSEAGERRESLEQPTIFKDAAFQYVILGKRENKICYLVYYETDPEKEEYLQYDAQSQTSRDAFYSGLLAGYEILQDFIVRNNFEPGEQWEETYRNLLSYFEQVVFAPAPAQEAQPVAVLLAETGWGFEVSIPEMYDREQILFYTEDSDAISFHAATGRITGEKSGCYTAVLAYQGDIQIFYIQVGSDDAGDWVQGVPVAETRSGTAFTSELLEAEQETEIEISGMYFDFSDGPLFFGEIYLNERKQQGGVLVSNQAAMVRNGFALFTLFYWDGGKYDSLGTLFWNQEEQQLLLQTNENTWVVAPTATAEQAQAMMEEIFSVTE